MFRLNYIFIILAITLQITGCGDKSRLHDLQKYVAEIKAESLTQEQKPITLELKLPPAISYENQIGGANGNGVNPANAAKPLQAYPLKALQFVGVITQNNQTWAYILTPDNMIYGAKEGDIIGNTYGKIIKIESNHLDVLQNISNEGKPATQEIVSLQLKE